MCHPFLSIVVVSYQSREDLQRCLHSLFAQQVEALELIIVDNSPGDGTAEWLAEAYPQALVLVSPDNLGYAGGFNSGLAHARGEWVLLLNPDTEFEPGALPRLLQTAASYPDALITPKLLNPDGTVNACGLELHYTGIASCRGLNRDSADFAGLQAVPLASGAAILARKRLFLELGGMDDAYFMYMEDVDLSLRACLLGYSVLCDADAAVRHQYALGMNPSKFMLLERNRLLTLARLFEGRTLARLFPALFLTELGSWAFALLCGPRYLLAKLDGYRWLWRHWREWRASRFRVQSTRRVADRELLSRCSSHLPLGQLTASPRLAEALERLSSAAYRLLRPSLGEARP